MIQNLFENQEPAKSQSAVVIVGRFQPPTIGHYRIVNLAKKYIRENSDLNLYAKPIIVIINGKKSSENKKENPLTVEERIFYMKNSGRANGVTFISANNAFAGFNEVRKEGFEPIVIGAGSDRAKGYIEMLDSNFLDKNGNKQKHYILQGLDTRKQIKSPEEIEKNIPISSVSGSLARDAARLNYFEEFVSITGLDKNIPAAKKLFKRLRELNGDK